MLAGTEVAQFTCVHSVSHVSLNLMRLSFQELPEGGSVPFHEGDEAAKHTSYIKLPQVISTVTIKSLENISNHSPTHQPHLQKPYSYLKSVLYSRAS